MCWLDWFICLITHQKQTALITEALQNILISEKASSSPSLVFLMILVYKIENQLIWLQEKNMVFLLDLNLKCKLGKVDIFMILNLPIKACSVSFHLLTSSVIYFMPFFRGFFPPNRILDIFLVNLFRSILLFLLLLQMESCMKAIDFCLLVS